ncbi:CRISPR-associated protein, Csd1-type, partial [human gut metagenome]
SSDQMDQTQLNSIMNKIADGQTVIWDDVEIYPKDEFYILGLSPNAARLSVRFFLRTTFGGMAQNLSRHYENIRVSHGPKNKDYLSLWNLLSETVNQKSKDKTPSPQLAGNLARAVLEGGFLSGNSIYRCSAADSRRTYRELRKGCCDQGIFDEERQRY